MNKRQKKKNEWRTYSEEQWLDSLDDKKEFLTWRLNHLKGMWSFYWEVHYYTTIKLKEKKAIQMVDFYSQMIDETEEKIRNCK